MLEQTNKQTKIEGVAKHVPIHLGNFRPVRHHYISSELIGLRLKKYSNADLRKQDICSSMELPSQLVRQLASHKTLRSVALLGIYQTTPSKRGADGGSAIHTNSGSNSILKAAVQD